MKGRVLMFLLMTIHVGSHAQSWSTGSPINQLYIDYPDSVPVTFFCDTMSGIQAVFHLPIPSVTGISIYVHVDFLSHSNDSVILSQGANSQTMHLNDSMLLFVGLPDSSVYLRYAGVETFASVKFVAVGTPVTAGQAYACPSVNQGWFYQGIGCLFPNYADMNATCTVQNVNGIDELMNQSEIFIYPNPASGNLFFEVKHFLDADDLKLLIFNSIGKRIQQLQITNHITNVNLESFNAGLYFYKLENKGKLISTGKFAKE